MFKRFSISRKPADPPSEKKEEAHPVKPDTEGATSAEIATPAEGSSHPGPADVHKPEADPKDVSQPDSPPVASPPKAEDAPSRPSADGRGFSFRPLWFIRGNADSKPTSTPAKEAEKAVVPPSAQPKPQPKPLTGSEKQAQESALIVRTLIVGSSGEFSKAVGKSQLSKVKALLMQPKSANKVIAALRALPGSVVQVDGRGGGGIITGSQTNGLIHAVCLPYTEQEAHDQHFSQLVIPPPAEQPAGTPSLPSVASANIGAVTGMLKNMHVINLITTPNLGIGQPGDGEGILSGAVPTAETVINGIVKVTPSLMALGFATGKVLLPDHHGGSSFPNSRQLG